MNRFWRSLWEHGYNKKREHDLVVYVLYVWVYPCIYIDLCTVPYSISLHGCFNSHMLSLEFACLADDYPVPQPAPSTCHVLVVQCDRCQPKPAGRTASLSQYSLVMALWDWKHLSGMSVSGALERLGRLSTLLHCHILSGHHAPFFEGANQW